MSKGNALEFLNSINLPNEDYFIIIKTRWKNLLLFVSHIDFSSFISYIKIEYRDYSSN